MNTIFHIKPQDPVSNHVYPYYLCVGRQSGGTRCESNVVKVFRKQDYIIDVNQSIFPGQISEHGVHQSFER